MKQLISIFALLLCTCIARAGDGDKRIGLKAGLLYHNTLNTTISYEKEMRYGDAIEFVIDLGNKWEKDPECGKVCTKSFWRGYYWGIGGVYKYTLSRGKNSIFHFRVGPEVGANKGKFDFGLEVGFEYTIVSFKEIEFCLMQKNQVMFRSSGDQRFRNGLLLGIKIPL